MSALPNQFKWKVAFNRLQTCFLCPWLFNSAGEVLNSTCTFFVDDRDSRCRVKTICFFDQFNLREEMLHFFFESGEVPTRKSHHVKVNGAKNSNLANHLYASLKRHPE